MKKYLLVLTLFIGAFSSCKKTGYDPVKQAATDDAAIQAYIKANNLTPCIYPDSALLLIGPESPKVPYELLAAISPCDQRICG